MKNDYAYPLRIPTALMEQIRAAAYEMGIPCSQFIRLSIIRNIHVARSIEAEVLTRLADRATGREHR